MRGEQRFISASVEHCTGRGFIDATESTATTAVKRLRMQCAGCGVTLVFTATLRVEAGTAAQLELA